MSGGELNLDLLFDAEDLDGLLSGGFAVEEAGEEERQELHLLSRRISGQYVDVVVAFAAASFSGRPSDAARQQLGSALDALGRLAAASQDVDLTALLERLRVLQADAEANSRGSRAKFIKAMRQWVVDFAVILPAEDAERVRSLVAFDRRTLPLLDKLAALKGIGPRRLERLYAAGLFTVEVVSAADPSEVAAVTGLPLDLAAQVVAASVQFAAEQRRRCVEELGERAAELRAATRTTRIVDPLVLEAARAAIRELQGVLANLEHQRGEVG